MSEKKASHKLLSNPQDVEKAIKGEKTQIRRSEKYVQVGDIMELEGHRFEFTNIYQQKLGDMTEEDVRAEGYSSLEDYKKHLKNLHSFTRVLPFLPWFKSMKVWVHEFRRID
ncbi:MAG TPA: ASCH domain-containing protein [Bacillales bacterium]|nr:ASCH domain-containing protein [Bacillales bacterium]